MELLFKKDLDNYSTSDIDKIAKMYNISGSINDKKWIIAIRHANKKQMLPEDPYIQDIILEKLSLEDLFNLCTTERNNKECARELKRRYPSMPTDDPLEMMHILHFLKWKEDTYDPDRLERLLTATEMKITIDKKMPPGIGYLKNLQTLEIKVKPNVKFPFEIENLSGLRELSLMLKIPYDGIAYGYHIKDIDISNVLHKLTNLETLQLSDWSLEPNTRRALGEMKSLRHLITHRVNIPDDITQLNQLEILEVDNSGDMPKDIGKLENLKTLVWNSSSLYFEGIPQTIGNLKNLEVLTLKEDKLSTLPDTIGNLTRLRELNLYKNPLESLPDTIGNLTNLLKINLDGTRFRTFPKQLLKLKNLESLNLDRNLIKSIPKEIDELQNLKYFKIERGVLKSIPSEIGNLSKLEELYLAYNELTEIPKEIGNLENLKKLFIMNNRITNIPDAIRDLNIQTFWVMGNPLDQDEG